MENTFNLKKHKQYLGLIALVIILALPFMGQVAFGSDKEIRGFSHESASQAEKAGHETYLSILAILEDGDDTIDYNTLVYVYSKLTESKRPIPHMDHLLKLLINKRNGNPRVDQMILIFSARAIRNSKFPIPNIYKVFESILKMEDSRLNEWVIFYVSSAIGGYAFSIPDGDRLVDLLEERLDRIESTHPDSKEYYGFHFLPPPRSDYLRSYIEGIEEKRVREIERLSYYSLIRNNNTEIQIEAALKYIQAHGIAGTHAKSPFALKYLVQNIESVLLKIDKNPPSKDEEKDHQGRETK